MAEEQHPRLQRAEGTLHHCQDHRPRDGALFVPQPQDQVRCFPAALLSQHTRQARAERACSSDHVTARLSAAEAQQCHHPAGVQPCSALGRCHCPSPPFSCLSLCQQAAMPPPAPKMQRAPRISFAPSAHRSSPDMHSPGLSCVGLNRQACTMLTCVVWAWTGRHADPEVYPRPDGSVYICGEGESVPLPDDPLTIQSNSTAKANLMVRALALSQSCPTAQHSTAQHSTAQANLAVHTLSLSPSWLTQHIPGQPQGARPGTLPAQPLPAPQGPLAAASSTSADGLFCLPRCPCRPLPVEQQLNIRATRHLHAPCPAHRAADTLQQ